MELDDSCYLALIFSHIPEAGISENPRKALRDTLRARYTEYFQREQQGRAEEVVKCY